MRFIHAVRIAVASGAAALLLAGCGPGTTSAPPPVVPPSTSNVPPQGTPPPVTPPFTPAAGGVLNAVERAKAENDLKQIGLAYHSYWDSFGGKGPTKVDDLYPFLEGAGTPPAKGLASGKYKVYLNATVAQMTNGTSNTVLGYYEGTPAAGGLVLMADVAVKNMTADDFKNAPKAGQ